MLSILATILFSGIAVMNILLIAGLPLGEFTMGGRYKVLPGKMKIAAVFNLVVQIFAIVVVLQGGGYLKLWFSYEVTRVICYVFAGFMALNSVMNFCSWSKKDKYIMTPLAIAAAVCFFVTGWRLK